MLLSLSLILLIGYIAICTLVLVFQRAILFPSGGDLWRDPSSMGWSFNDVWLEHETGKTHAWHIHIENPSGTVLFSHGNAGTIADRLESVDDFVSLGFDVLIYDYGGYGRSDGRPSEARCNADIQAAWDYLIEEKELSPAEIVLFGRSLGAGPTSWLATRVEPAAVILESAFMSVTRMAQESFPFLPMRLLVRDRFDNEGRIAEIESPLLVMHSRDDEIIPFRHGERLFEKATDPKQFYEIRGGHNDGWYISRAGYRASLGAFLSSVGA